MNIPQIQISQTLGRIGLQIRPADVEIHSHNADLQIHYTPTDLNFEQVPGDLQIDQTQAFSDEGVMPPLQEAEDYSAKARQTALQGTEDTASWGQEFIRPHGTSISTWLSRYADKMVTLEPALVPSPFSVHIHYTMGHLVNHTTPGNVDIGANLQKPDVNYAAGSVHGYIEQQAQLKIIPPKFDAKI